MPTAPKTCRPAGQASSRARYGGKSKEAYERARKYRTKAWEDTRIRIMARDAMVCQACGYMVLHKGDAHIDHIIAVEQGGSDDDENLQLLHGSCHSRKTIRTRN